MTLRQAQGTILFTQGTMHAIRTLSLPKRQGTIYGSKDPDYERLKEEIATPCEARFAMTEGEIIHLRCVRATSPRGGH
ncbi:MAG: hypothetical protein WAN57_09635 [Smithella sp.]